jgi:hypothetical protein
LRQLEIDRRLFSFHFPSALTSLLVISKNNIVGAASGFLGMFELPNDDKRRKLWTIRVKRKDFVQSNSSTQ